MENSINDKSVLAEESFIGAANPAYIEAMYKQYQESPESISDDWRIFFTGYHFFLRHSSSNIVPQGVGGDDTSVDYIRNSNIVKFIHTYRARGHLIANLNPIGGHTKANTNEFEPIHFGLREADMHVETRLGNEMKIGAATFSNIHKKLKKIYCSNIGYEFMNCRNEQLRNWLLQEIEEKNMESSFSATRKKKILEMMMKATLLEDFLQTKYVGQKRFSLEGCEALIPALQQAIEIGVGSGIEEFVFGMAHRGRLNVLVNILKKSHHQLFTEFEGGILPEEIKGDGDVKYHLGQSNDIMVNGKKIHLSLAFNPSHLEAVNAVVSGMVQAKTKKYYANDFEKIIPIIIHGDAAVAGQGIVYELANLSKIRHYDNGGTLHIVLDNQIGFTAVSKETRGGIYASDIAKITDSPVFHVNADAPEAVSYATELAIKVRQKFAIDVWINIIGFRKRGHNEGDEPKFTQPKMYEIINRHPGALKLYADQLRKEEVVSENAYNKLLEDEKRQLEKSLNTARAGSTEIKVDTLKRYWQDIRPSVHADFEKSIETGITPDISNKLFSKIQTVPKGFNLFSKMRKILEARQNNYSSGKVDWGIAEQLAFASILNEGRSVRIAGQDSQRGTFGHRHAVWRDVKTEENYKSLDSCVVKFAKFYAINTQLSEYAILGYEYGYSLSRPHALVIWEAQFGDFANGAQIIIDQFVSSGETKWQRHSGLVMLLPHGYEGMGPEHSSGRVERFLQLCAQENMFVCNITSPANYFHALRRQIKASFRKPLIVMSPKSLLRHPKVISPIEDIISKGASFKEILDDETANAGKVKRVLLCTGKIYFQLDEYRETNAVKDVAIVRFEQLYPFSNSQLETLKKKYKQNVEWVWVQEEPENMGAWRHIKSYLGDRFNLSYVARKGASSPAEGIAKKHAENQEKIVKNAFSSLTSKEINCCEKVI